MMRASEPKKPREGERRRRNDRREQTQKPEHEGGTENQVGDRTGPGAGYDDRSERIRKVSNR
jgi:hypothetical protein